MPGGVLDLDSALDWPWIVSYRWEMATPFGRTQTEITVNAPPVQGDLRATEKLGVLLWDYTVATATASSVELVACWYKAWRTGWFGVSPDAPRGPGALPGPASGRADSGCLVLHTDHADRLATRRFILPGFPAAYTDDGLTTVAGRMILEGLAHRMAMGMLGTFAGQPLGLMIRYDAGDLEGLPVAGAPLFRGVRRIRVMHHTARAPDLAPPPWMVP